MRDRDVRNAIRDALEATGAFEGVWLSGLPEDYGQAASDLTAAAIEPASRAKASRWDAGPDEIGIDVNATCKVTLLARNQDPQLRDELAEQLLAFLDDAVNGKALAGLTLPDRTLVSEDRWQNATPPERRIVATVKYEYVTTGWDSFDTSE